MARSILALALAALIGMSSARAAFTPEQAQAVSRVETYLNGIGTMRARFIQIGPDGRQAAGELLLDRPSRMRLDYDPPSRVLIVTEGFRIVYYDGALKQVSYIPIGSTPLGFLLDDRIRLSGDVVVEKVEDAAGEIRVTVSQAKEPAAGRVTLSFSSQPLELRRWSVQDAQGLVTHVVLEQVERGVRLDRDLFHFRNPRIYGYPED
jgi:outer membrane lipoprotein-sorting protein